MMFALVSIIYPRITMVDQYSDIREHLQTFNVDHLGTSKMDIYHDCALSTRQLRWEDCVKRDVRKAEEEEHWREKANNRDQWKRIKKVAAHRSDE